MLPISITPIAQAEVATSSQNDLEQILRTIDAVHAELKAYSKQIAAELEQRLVVAAVQAKLDRMPAPQMEVLKRLLHPAGVASESRVGNIGKG